MPFRLGINYWPITSAMYWWQRFDHAEVNRDFSLIRSTGFDSVRIFLLWEDFQPQSCVVSKRSLAQLKVVADIAADQSLSLIPTLFTGHMSGVNWIPKWALGPAHDRQRFRVVAANTVVEATPRNWYTDEEVLKAQIRLAGEVADALQSHRSVWAWDLGNENSNCVVPPNREAGLEWLERITTALRSVDRDRPITLGLHMEDLQEDRKLGPAEAAKFCDFLCMHGYPIYASWSRGATDAYLLPFLGLITHWLGGRDVLFEEFGAPTSGRSADTELPQAGMTLLTESDATHFTSTALSLLNQYGFLGGFLWCYADYAPWLWHLPPLDQSIHERYFGIWRADGNAKPAVKVVDNFSGTSRKPLLVDTSWIDIKPGDFYDSPEQNLRRLYQRFLLTTRQPQH